MSLFNIASSNIIIGNLLSNCEVSKHKSVKAVVIDGLINLRLTHFVSYFLESRSDLF